MLHLSQFHKETRFYSTITQGALPTSVYAWVENDRYRLQRIDCKDFKDYQFVGYRYESSYYPNVERITP